MLDSIHAAQSPETASRGTGVNTTSKAELLRRAKAAVEAGAQSLQEAAEALGLAKEDHAATQREMAEAVGMSASWVNKLLKWRRSGYKEYSPFGPTTKRGRVEHAQQRAKLCEPRKASTEPQANADDAEVSAAKRKLEYAKQETEPETAPLGETQILTSEKSSPAEAKSNLICALDQWWPYLDDAGKREVIDRFLDKADRWDDDAAGTTLIVRESGGAS